MMRAAASPTGISALNACSAAPTTTPLKPLLGSGTSEAGNYVVTVTLGGAAAGDTYVSAESTRGMLKSVTTTQASR